MAKKRDSVSAFYEAVVETETFSEDAYSGTFIATKHTRSPWSGKHQHAGPPCALLVRALEMLTIPTSNALTNQLSVNIFAPIPTGAIAVTAQVVHEGHFTSLVEAELSRAGYAEPIMRVSGWRTRRVPVNAPGWQQAAAGVPAKGRKAKPPAAWAKGFSHAVRWRTIEGALGGAGRTTAWARPQVNLVDDEPVSGIPLVALVAATTSTLSALTDAADTVVVSTDLDLHALREPVGPSLWITTESFLDTEGVGVATSTLGDTQGSLAVGNQSLFLADRSEVRY